MKERGCGSYRASVLVVANRLPYPLDDGWKRRTFHVLKGLSRKNEVTLASLHDGSLEHVQALSRVLDGKVEVLTAATPPLRGPAAALLGALTPLPYHVWRQRSAALRRVIAAANSRRAFDVAFTTMTHHYPYLQVLGPHACRLVDTHNIDSLVLEQYARSMRGPKAVYARVTARKLHRHEAAVFGSADRVIICSEREKVQVREIAPAALPVVIPNGVDADGAFAPVDVPPAPRRLVFFGRLDYYPNRDAVEYFVSDLLPGILAQVPDAEFHVIGPGASPALRALAANIPAVKITGAVPDLRPVVGRAALVVVPLRLGGGTRLKILEALALEKPVVSTRVGAEGLDLQSGHDLVLADDPEDFIRNAVRLLLDPVAGRCLGQNGRQTVRRLYDWSVIERQIETLVATSMNAAR